MGSWVAGGGGGGARKRGVVGWKELVEIGGQGRE